MKKIVLAVLLVAGFASGAAEARHDGCSPSLYFRTPEQVLDDHRQAIADQDWDAVRCNYAKGARVISDQGITIGRDGIVADLQGFAQLFGGVTPTVTEQVTTGGLARVLFEIDLGFATIPDGVDTYVIIFGQIHRQTAHGSLVFSGPPPTP